MKRDTLAVLQRKRALVRERASGLEHASSTALSASYGLAIEEVRRELRSMGVRDDG